METKQVIVIRKDLGMRKGKMIAQGAHASMKAILDLMDVSDWGPYVERSMVIQKHKPLYDWLEGKFAKIVVSCNSELELFSYELLAKEAGLIHALIRDEGKTEFNGVPTYTALAIGPDEAEKIDKITGHLKLL